MSIASNTCSVTNRGMGNTASCLSTLRNDLRGQLLLRHQNSPCLSVALATNIDGGQIIVAARSLESSRSGSLNTRPPKSFTSFVRQIFAHTSRSGTPPVTIFGQYLRPTRTRKACMKRTKNTHPPLAAAKSATSEMRAESSRKRNAVFAAISLRCALCALQYSLHVMFGGFSCRSRETKHSVAEVMAPKTARKRRTSNPERPRQYASGDEHAIPTYAWSVATGRIRNTVSTSCIPRRSISAFLCLRSFVRSALHAANAVPSWHIAQIAPRLRTIFLKSNFVNPKTFVCCDPASRIARISASLGIG